MMTTTFLPGFIYDVNDLERNSAVVGWSDGQDNPGYAWRDYFNGDGSYRGPDVDGVEPVVDVAYLPPSHWVSYIMRAETLDELLEHIETAEAAAAELERIAAWHDGYDPASSKDALVASEALKHMLQVTYSDLPTYGGLGPGDVGRPADLEGVYSWDRERLLLADDCWHIVPRDGS